MAQAWANADAASSNSRPVASDALTSLKRWSCHTKELPAVDAIGAIHVYDFDNTCALAIQHGRRAHVTDCL